MESVVEPTEDNELRERLAAATPEERERVLREIEKFLAENIGN